MLEHLMRFFYLLLMFDEQYNNIQKLFLICQWQDKYLPTPPSVISPGRTLICHSCEKTHIFRVGVTLLIKKVFYVPDPSTSPKMTPDRILRSDSSRVSNGCQDRSFLALLKKRENKAASTRLF